MTVLIATILSFLVVILLQENAIPTRNKTKLTAALVLLFVSATLYASAYGTMRGTFILLGVLSVLGTLFTLLRYKLIKR